MIKVYINNSDGKGDVDYTSYVLPSTIQIQKSLNVPTQCSMSLVGSDNSFKVPIPRSYIRIYSTVYMKYLFTGYLVTDPAIAFTGLSQSVPGTNFQMYQYDLSCTSDEYLLNIKSVDFIPAFVNRTQGEILRTLAEILAPGFFSYDYIDDGDLVPYLAYDPTKSWYEYAKEFGDASRFRYSCVDRQIHYKPYGDGELGIKYDENLGEGTFDPTSFSSKPLTTPIVNDVTIVGGEEGGNNREDFFIGTGFNGAFGLKHKVFGLASNFQGSSVLLSDNWNANQLNTQNWFAMDLAAQFDYSQGALNIVTGFEMPPGDSYIYANNGIELAGSVIAQHGEVQFNDVSTGIIGGFYADSTLAVSGCLAGFNIATGPVVELTISGASGIEISPLYNGLAMTGAFLVTSKINKSYTMYTRTSAPLPVRYYQVYRSLAGTVYGGYTTAENVIGTITLSLLETDIFSGEMNTWTYTVTGAKLPDTAVYGLINNQQLNITLNSTSIWTPPPASLKIACEIGASPLGEFYLSGNVQYTGAFITPSGGNLPIRSFGVEQQFDLGSGIGNQAGEIDSGQQVDSLNFYSNDLPAPGARIRLQTWESQVAVSRMRSAVSISGEAQVVGDDGVRASTVTNLVPLPRTSEDCDNAAAAFLEDRVNTFYQGSYNASYYFFNQFSNDIDFYPTCGRYLYVNAPNRRIVRQNLLVTQLTTTVEEMAGEIVNHNISFGPDTYLEKILSSIVPIPTNVLQPIDTAIQPTPQQLEQIGYNYLPDIFNSTVVGQISGAQLVLSLQDNLAIGAVYEIRSADWNWGQNDNYLMNRYSSNQIVTIPRVQYDQTWFIRQVKNPGTSSVQTSRRSKVLRVSYPRIPTPPMLLTVDTLNVNMDLSGDTRNIEGLELRQEDDTTVVYQCIVGTRFDTFIDMDELRNQILPGQQGLSGLGKFMVEPFASGSRTLQAHFFNLMWEYSDALTVYMAPAAAPTVVPGYRWGPQILLNITPDPIDDNRTDLKTVHSQFSSDSGFSSGSIIQDAYAANTGFFTTTVPITGDIYVRSQYVDHIGSGAWSGTVYIPLGDLIASDYLTAQGSVPTAVIDNASGAAGGVIYYRTVGNVIYLNSVTFNIEFPNGATVQVPAMSGTYLSALDTSGAMLFSTDYGFFPSLKDPTTDNPSLEFNGPYVNYASNSSELVNMYQDGSVPITQGAFIVQTSPLNGNGTGSGGGSLA